MRKFLILGTALAVILTSIAASYAAYEPASGKGGYAKGASKNAAALFVDEDGDGVCDNTGTYAARRGRATSENPEGFAYKNRSKNQNKENFVDENGDGICDNIGTRPNFVDEDGDGVCDNCSGDCPPGTAPKDGTGMQNRRGGRGRNSN